MEASLADEVIDRDDGHEASRFRGFECGATRLLLILVDRFCGSALEGDVNIDLQFNTS